MHFNLHKYNQNNKLYKSVSAHGKISQTRGTQRENNKNLTAVNAKLLILRFQRIDLTL